MNFLGLNAFINLKNLGSTKQDIVFVFVDVEIVF